MAMSSNIKSRHCISRAVRRIGATSLLVGLAATSVAVLPAGTASADTFSVTNCGDSGPGSLRAEVVASPAKSTITFAPSVASCSPIVLTSGPIAISKRLTITGPGLASLAVSGGGLVGVFSVSSSGNTTISGLAIENGNAGSGAGGANDNVSVPTDNATAAIDGGGNGGSGGGISNTGTLTLKSDSVTGNSAGSGGNGGNGTATIGGNSDVATIGDGGNGGNGGGIYNTGTLTLTDDTISGNGTGPGGNGGQDIVMASGASDTLNIGSGNGGNGGGIYNTGTLTLTGDTVSGNMTGAGGIGGNDNVTATGDTNTLNVGSGNGGEGAGIYSTGDLTLTNDTVSGDATGAPGTAGSDEFTVTGTGDVFNIYNGAGGNGGGIYNDGPATITATTVSANSAVAGGGISFDASTLSLGDSIVANSPSGGNCAFAGGTLVDSGYDLDSGTTCELSGPGDLTNANPQLGTLEANGGPTATMAIASTSPAVDTIPVGINGCGTTLKTDQRGVLRPQGTDCDSGAYEYGDIAMQNLTASPHPVPTSSDLTYTATVSNAGATDATGVAVTDTVPAGEKLKSVETGQGSCSMSSKTVTCTLGQMEAATTVKVTIVVKVTAVEGKKVRDSADVSATTGDTIPGNDSKSVGVTVS
jgi:uncharacterized repeat protein (TIGR01451 family)